MDFITGRSYGACKNCCVIVLQTGRPSGAKNKNIFKW